jgi:tetratricopeptide (TPR) repeat protein
VLLRQGLLYRQMGAPTLALSKFYAVMTSALSLKQGGVDYYQRLVLHAQTEIAETYYVQAKYDEAAEFLRRLLKLESGEINRSQVQFKLVRCLAGSSKHAEVIAQAQEFLTRYPGASEEPEVRFLLASSYKKLDQNKEALRQVLLLLQSQQNASNQTAGGWAYWQQRAGNQIANQMYQEGDYLNALEIYSALAVLDESPAWQLPVWYQIGLIYERLQQPDKATGLYDRINSREKELASDARPGLKTVLDMAKWRIEFLTWQTQADRFTQTNAQLKASPPTSAAQ